MFKIKLNLLSLKLKQSNPLLIKKNWIQVSTHFSNRDKGTYFITTPIYYVNAEPHLGHLYTSIVADVLLRHEKSVLPNQESLLSTGTDEHGQKIHQSSLKASMKPKEFCDLVSSKFKELIPLAGLDLDNVKFIRTTQDNHYELVKKIWDILVNKGMVYKSEYEGWYSVSDEAFYTESEVEEKIDVNKNSIKVAKVSGSEVIWTKEPTYKFRLSKFSQPLIEWIENNPEVIQPETRRNEVLSSLREGLEDLSISRPKNRVPWGIEVPNDPSQTIYVWLDALFNYLTITKSDPPSLINDLFPADVHIVGKDILKFHAIYWPAFLMACDLPLPKCILAHGHWTVQGGKMSKSKGNALAPGPLIQKYGVDAVRFYLLRDGGNFADDHDFNEATLKVKYKKELMGLLGNLFKRLTSKALNPESKVPEIDFNQLDKDSKIIFDNLNSISSNYAVYMKNYQISKSVNLIIDQLLQLNKYIQDHEPWKPDVSKARPEVVVRLCLEAMRILAILLKPIMPSKAHLLLEQLNVPNELRYFKYAKIDTELKDRNLIITDGVLFKKLE